MRNIASGQLVLLCFPPLERILRRFERVMAHARVALNLHYECTQHHTERRFLISVLSTVHEVALVNKVTVCILHASDTTYRDI
jgi:hypothetical protein